MTTIEAKITSPSGVNVTMEITMTLSSWLRLMDDLAASIIQGSRPKNDYTKQLIDAIDAFSSELSKPSSLYISPGMASVMYEPPQEEKKNGPGN